MRDGEVLAKHLVGVGGFKYPSMVPYALDCIEADYLPFDRIGENPKITHGIERDEWGTITAYHLLKRHPGEFLVPGATLTTVMDTDRFPADVVLHLRIARRLGQLRGISIFHPSVHRLQDLTDYEESERLTAKIAASFSAVITRSPDAPGATDYQSAKGNRTFEMQPAMVFDGLLPGESVETIDSNRPNNALGEYRSSMLKAVSAGTGARYSTIARTWDSSYTAMRQETVTVMPGTDRMQDYYVARFIRPVYEMWLRTAIATGAFDVGRTDPMTVFDADYRGPAIPWLDPKDEAEADVIRVTNRFKSRRQVIRESGGDPDAVDEEIAMDGGLTSTEQDNEQTDERLETA